MPQQSEPGRKYGNADGYDSYMGGWSAALSPLFVDFVGIEGPVRIVDIGCGTGNLLAALASNHPDASLVGIDPSEALLAKARLRPELARATFETGAVEALPLEARSADFTLSMLVLQEFYDRALALNEMRRVTRAGGVIAACQWDFARMPIIATLVEAIEHVNATAGRRISSGSPRVFADEAELRLHWDEAGLVNVTAGRITVGRNYPRFDDLWRPLLAGSTPSTLTLAALVPEERDAVRAMM